MAYDYSMQIITEIMHKFSLHMHNKCILYMLVVYLLPSLSIWTDGTLTTFFLVLGIGTNMCDKKEYSLLCYSGKWDLLCEAEQPNQVSYNLTVYIYERMRHNNNNKSTPNRKWCFIISSLLFSASSLVVVVVACVCALHCSFACCNKRKTDELKLIVNDSVLIFFMVAPNQNVFIYEQ